MCMNQYSAPAEERAAALLDAEAIKLQRRIETLKAKAASLRGSGTSSLGDAAMGRLGTSSLGEVR